MRRLLSLFVLACPLVLSGCITILGGAALAAATNDESEAVKYYVSTHDVEPRIERAMREERIVEGMTKEEVRIVMEEAQSYPCDEREAASDGTTWVCENPDPKWVGRHVIHFQEGTVVRAQSTE